MQSGVKGKKGFQKQPKIEKPVKEKEVVEIRDESDEAILEQLQIDVDYELPDIDLTFDAEQIKVTRLVLSPELVAVALYEARGKVTIAARKLGTTARVVNRFIKDYIICATAQEEADEMLLDFAEAKLMQKIKVGDIASIIFYLRTKGKKRGYTEKEASDAANTRETQEEARREAEDREKLLLDRLAQIGERLKGSFDIELGADSYSQEDRQEQESYDAGQDTTA